MEIKLFQYLVGSRLKKGLIFILCRVDSTEDGDYRLCFDNSFSKLSEKMVFFEVINSQGDAGGGREEWANITASESLVEYKLEEIRVRGRNISHPLTILTWCDLFCTFVHLAGQNGLSLLAPGEEPAGPNCAEGLWGPGPLPAGGQPVESVLLVLHEPDHHAHCCSLTDLHPAASLRRHQAGPHMKQNFFLPPAATDEHYIHQGLNLKLTF